MDTKKARHHYIVRKWVIPAIPLGVVIALVQLVTSRPTYGSWKPTAFVVVVAGTVVIACIVGYAVGAFVWWSGFDPQDE